ncbi:hypothetical protein V6N11_048858 [Hibiscus sabdariffa]|uniref:Uncharacterized protein n=1 Tax=Hibiscus sabdariffa TaxID=183260 RepID=A0ABR2PWH8_9ROSI
MAAWESGCNANSQGMQAEWQEEVKSDPAKEHDERYLCAWGNDAASEVLTEARLLLVENYFQTPSSASVQSRP